MRPLKKYGIHRNKHAHIKKNCFFPKNPPYNRGRKFQ